MQAIIIIIIFSEVSSFYLENCYQHSLRPTFIDWKIFVGGLPHSVDSGVLKLYISMRVSSLFQLSSYILCELLSIFFHTDCLKECFQAEFGPVELVYAIVQK